MSGFALIWLMIGGGLACVILVRNALRKEPVVPQINPETLSVVIPFRNERDRIDGLLNSLKAQTVFPNHIVFVDDHSDDDTVRVIHESLINCSFNWELVSMPTDCYGKKMAIFEGLKKVSTSAVVTLDADVLLPIHYFDAIPSLGRYKMITLPVYMTGNGLVGKWMELEYASFQLLQGSVDIEKPLMASGANLLFEKEAYLTYNDLSVHGHIASGDDQFALAAFLRNDVPVRTCLTAGAAVETETPIHFSALLKQRWRWLGNNTSGNDWRAVFFSFWVLLYNLSFISLVLMSVLSGYWSQALLWWVFKILLDITVYIPWFFRWRKWRMACVMPLLSITYPYYLIVLGLGYLFADVQWKKRPLRV